MASPATQPTTSRDRLAGEAGVSYEDFVDTRLRKTRAAVKAADLATAAVTLIAWTLGVLLLGAVTDHWIVAGGFDRWGRFALLAIGLLGAGLYVATRLGPTLWLRINPLYAAREIERESPELKNSLLNLLQLRGTPGAGAAVQQTLERQAAERLAATGDASIDRTPVVRAARMLLALVAVIGLYVVASPKDFFASAGRILAPWAEIAAPSRVQITDLTPGEVGVAQGSRLEVSAFVAGLGEEEFAELVYSTADGRVVDGRVPMRSSTGGQQHTASLPPGSGAAAAVGLQGDLIYRLEAGDARTPNYRVEVQTAPTIAPVRVRYQYPPYTGFASREVEGVGDLRGIDGTQVTITARANLPIAAAQIDIGSDGRADATMRADGDVATGQLTLRRDPADATQTTTTYVLRFTSTDDQANHAPPQYRLEVLADLAPEAALLLPEEATLDVAVNQRVRIEGEARDPDFALSRMRLVGVAGGRPVLARDLPHGAGRGRVKGTATVTPSELGLQPGDTLIYWIEAADNRTPEANRVRSESQELRIIGPSEDTARDGKPDATGRDGQPQRSDDGEARPGESSPDRGQQGEPNASPDGNSNDPKPGSNTPRGQESAADGNERPQAEQAEDEPSQDGESSDGGISGPGQEGGQEGDSDQAPEGGSEGGAEGENNAEPAAGGAAGSNSADDNPGGNAAENSGDPSGGNSRSANEPGSDNDQPSTEEPVPSSGEDDGSAFERIRKFLQDQQNPGQGDQPSPRDASQQSSDGERREWADPNGEPQEPAESTDEDGASSREPGQEGDSRPGSDQGETMPRDGGLGDQPERPEDGPGPGESDRSGQSSDSSTSESGGETPPGESTDPNAGPREGSGSSGQNQAADQGAGQSGDHGPGDSSGSPGGEQQADGETGQSGDRSGEGSESSSDRGDQPGGDGDPGQTRDGKGGEGSEAAEPGQSPANPQDPVSGEPGDEPGQEGKQPLRDMRGEGPGSEATDQRGKPVGFGDRGENAGEAGEGSEIGSDEANLEYAREQTDLVLEKLDEQLAEREVDRKLLDKLGWNEQELRKFVERWKTRKRQATQRGPQGEAQLDRALRSLGLRPEGPTAVRSQDRDQLRDLRQGTRTKVPARWRDAVQRYNQSLNASGDAASRGE